MKTHEVYLIITNLYIVVGASDNPVLLSILGIPWLLLTAIAYFLEKKDD